MEQKVYSMTVYGGGHMIKTSKLNMDYLPILERKRFNAIVTKEKLRPLHKKFCDILKESGQFWGIRYSKKIRYIWNKSTFAVGGGSFREEPITSWEDDVRTVEDIELPKFIADDVSDKQKEILEKRISGELPRCVKNQEMVALKESIDLRYSHVYSVISICEDLMTTIIKDHLKNKYGHPKESEDTYIKLIVNDREYIYNGNNFKLLIYPETKIEEIRL